MKLKNLSKYFTFRFFQCLTYSFQSRGFEEISHNVDHTLAHFLRTKPHIDKAKARRVLLQRQQRLIQTRNERRNSLVTQFLEAMQIRKREDAFRLVDQSNEAGADLFMLRVGVTAKVMKG